MSQISIIVPVYGAEKYLHRCLDSILAQTFTEWECILVDDGSKDRSGAICDEYAQKDSRFRVFHKKNGGVSSARQFGMERMIESDSKYSIHADPDDWMEPEMLERLFQKAEETGADMVICDYYMNTRDKQILIHQDPLSEKPQDVLNQLFLGLHGSLWNKLIRTACYKKANIKFPGGLNFCEDFYVNVCLLLHCISKVAYLPEAYYHYDNYSNDNSEIRNSNSKKIDFTHTEIVRLCRQAVPDKLKGWQYYYFENRKAFTIIIKGSMSNKEIRKFFKNMPYSLSMLWHHNNNPWEVMLACLVIHTLFGRNIVTYYYIIRHNIAYWLGVNHIRRIIRNRK